MTLLNLAFSYGPVSVNQYGAQLTKIKWCGTIYVLLSDECSGVHLVACAG